MKKFVIWPVVLEVMRLQRSCVMVMVLPFVALLTGCSEQPKPAVDRVPQPARPDAAVIAAWEEAGAKFGWVIIDPFGEIIAESDALDDDVVVGLVTAEKLENTSGSRYLKARRPDLYAKLVEPQQSVTLSGWEMER